MGKPGKESKKDKKDKTKDKESKKEKKEVKTDAGEEKEFDYDFLLKRCTIISKPMASEKLTKKVLKTTKKAAKAKAIRRGVKEVVKAVRKGEKGFVLIAGDISPIDVIAHLPILCEDMDVPYCYVPSKEQLGLAGNTKRPTSCLMIKTNSEIEKDFDECNKEIKSLEIPTGA